MYFCVIAESNRRPEFGSRMRSEMQDRSGKKFCVFNRINVSRFECINNPFEDSACDDGKRSILFIYY